MSFWIPDITSWWRQQEEMHLLYINLSNVARGIFSILPPAVGEQARYSLGPDVVGRSLQAVKNHRWDSSQKGSRNICCSTQQWYIVW